MFGVYENFSALIIIGQLIAYNQTLILSILFALPRMLMKKNFTHYTNIKSMVKIK